MARHPGRPPARRRPALLAVLLALLVGAAAACSSTVPGAPGTAGPGTTGSGTPTATTTPLDPDELVVTVVWARGTIAGPGTSTTATLRGDGRVVLREQDRGGAPRDSSWQADPATVDTVVTALAVLRDAPEVQATITDVGSVTVRYPDGPRTVSLTVDDWPASSRDVLSGDDRRTVDAVMTIRSALLAGAPGTTAPTGTAPTGTATDAVPTTR